MEAYKENTRDKLLNLLYYVHLWGLIYMALVPEGMLKYLSLVYCRHSS